MNTDNTRTPIERCYTNDELVGKRVRVISNASHRHYKMFGRIVGFSRSGDMIEVYFDETKAKARFYRTSLELVN